MIWKLLEYITFRRELDIQILKEGEEKRRNTEGESVWIKASGKSYSQVIQEIKEKVNVEYIGLKNGRIRKTESGYL